MNHSLVTSFLRDHEYVFFPNAWAVWLCSEYGKQVSYFSEQSWGLNFYISNVMSWKASVHQSPPHHYKEYEYF